MASWTISSLVPPRPRATRKRTKPVTHRGRVFFVAAKSTEHTTMPLIPFVIEKSGREERARDIYSRLLKDRIVFLGSQVNDEVANSIVARMLCLQSEDP